MRRRVSGEWPPGRVERARSADLIERLLQRGDGARDVVQLVEPEETHAEAAEAVRLDKLKDVEGTVERFREVADRILG